MRIKVMEAIAANLRMKPIVEKKPSFNVLGIFLVSATVYWLYTCVRFLMGGHILLGTSSYGATWGLAVANIVHLIGISHVGIAISAAVRVLKLEHYRNVARLAEWVTLITLVTAVVNIGLDVGRPDRFIINTLLYGRWYAPMAWSMTVITLYFLASLTYLYLSLRPDLGRLSKTDLGLKRLYKFLALGYEDTKEERDRHETTLFWLAVCLIPIMISVHSVYGFFFGLMPGRPGWTNPLQAPYFVLAAIVSGFSAILVIAGMLRWAYSWKELFPDRFFKVFGSFLAFVIFLYLYFVASEQITAQWARVPAEKALSDTLLFGRFSILFWSTILVGLIVPFSYLFFQGIKRGFVHVAMTSVAALLVNVAMLVKRFLIVVPAQYPSHLPLPRPAVPYVPSYMESVVTLGSYAFAAVLFLILLKLFPMVEIPKEVPPTKSEKHSSGRTLIMVLTLVAGVSMMAWGFSTRQYDYAVVKWLTGLVLLVAIPLERCLVPGHRENTTRGPDHE
jgi:molybdopterin-containing oxidoreductase family membrane subunit